MSAPSLPLFSVAFPEYSTNACAAAPDATHLPRHFSLSYKPDESRRCGRLHEALAKLELAAAKLSPWSQRPVLTPPSCAANRIESVACELEELHQHLSQLPPPKRAALAVAQQCSHCGLRETPEWRRGPSGSRTLCNACGLFFSKLNRKFGAAVAQLIMSQRQRYSRVHDRKVPATAA